LIPAKNALPFLRDCLQSILKQRYSNWEVLVVDDHSSDNTLRVLHEFALQDDRINVFQNQGAGIIAALNLAYAHSNGTYLTRMDADDLMPEGKLDLLHQALQENGQGFVSTGFVKYFSEDQLGQGYLNYEHWLNELTSNASNFTEIYKECVIPSPCWMMHRSDFEKIGAFRSEIYPEDYDLCFRMYQGRLKIAPVKEVCHYWREHFSRATRNDENYADNNFLLLKITKFLEIELKKDKKLVLWGAGSKGKWLAQFFVENQIAFQWMCDNPKKIGKEIYGQVIQDSKGDHFNSMNQYLVAVANKESLLEIKQSLIHQEAFYFA